MERRSLKNLCLATVTVSIALLAAMFMRSLLVERKSAATRSAEASRLADDVETVIKGYRYQENNRDIHVQISGDQIVHRGRPLLGLRSNVVKAIFFDGVEGSLKTAQKSLVFSAKVAEWGADLAHPLILKKEVVVSVNGTRLTNVKRAKIYFQQKLLEVDGTTRQIFKL